MTLLLLAFLTLVQMPSATIAGQVFRAESTEPVANARVLLTRVGGRPSESLVALADEQGRFSISNIPSGNYRLFAEHEDYVKAEFGQRNPSSPGSSIPISAGASLDGLRLDLTMTGVISGRVSDHNGEPVRARIQALRRSYLEGRPVFTAVADTSTNDLGEYRLYELPPGGYVVSASPYGYQRIQSGFYFGLSPLVLDALISIADAPRDIVNLTRGGDFIDAGAIEGITNAVRYFGGAGEPSSASLLVVNPGAVIAGTDIQMLSGVIPRVPNVKVRGQVIDGTSGQPVSTGLVQLSTPDKPFAMDSLSRTVRITPERKGEFEIDHVDPGDYAILASGPSSISSIIKVNVGSAGVEGLRLVLNPIVVLNGRISVEGERGNLDLTKVALTLRGQSNRQIMPKADGTFSAANLMPGNYQIALGPAISNVFLKTARMGAADVLASLPLSGPQQSVELVLSTKTATLEGFVSGENDLFAAAVRVVLIPDTARRDHFEDYRTAMSDRDGRFRIEGIPPGEYRVFAWENLEENTWQVPEILRPYEGQGKEVLLIEGGRETVNLRMIPQAIPASPAER